MKKIASGLFVLIILSNMSCALVFGGPITPCQKIKPAPGQPQREVRVGALIADIIFGLIPSVVDFATGAIYKPCRNTNSTSTHK